MFLAPQAKILDVLECFVHRNHLKNAVFVLEIASGGPSVPSILKPVNLNSGALRIRELWSSKNQYSGSWKRELWSAKNQNWSAKNHNTGSWERELWGEETVFCYPGSELWGAKNQNTGPWERGLWRLWGKQKQYSVSWERTLGR